MYSSSGSPSSRFCTAMKLRSRSCWKQMKSSPMSSWPARVGEPDMGVELRALAFGIVGIGGLVIFAPAAEGRAARLLAAHDRFLLAKRRTVPALDEIADDPHRLVAAVMGPFRLAGARSHPDEMVHQRLVGGVGVGGAVAEAQQVARAFRRLARFGLAHRHRALLLPA